MEFRAAELALALIAAKRRMRGNRGPALERTATVQFRSRGFAWGAPTREFFASEAPATQACFARAGPRFVIAPFPEETREREHFARAGPRFVIAPFPEETREREHFARAGSPMFIARGTS
jgi:hypothetical protein